MNRAQSATAGNIRLLIITSAFLLFCTVASAANTTDACGTLGLAGEAYTLNASVKINGSTCFTITAANVTLDCAGFTITGNNTTGTYGVYSNQFNTTVKNCNVSNFAAQIYLSGTSSFATVTNNTVSGSFASTVSPYGSGVGILVAGSNHTVTNTTGYQIGGQLIGLTAYDSKVDGATPDTGVNTTNAIYVYVGGRNNMTNIGGTSPRRIIIQSSTDNLVANSALGGTAGSQRLYITSNSHRTTVTNVSFDATSNTAIFIDGGSNVSIDCQGKSIIGTNTTSTYGVYSTQFNTTIKNCNISNFADGVRFNGADNSLATNNTIYITQATGVGIYALSTADNNVISGNSITTPVYDAIWYAGGTNATIANNTLAGGNYMALELGTAFSNSLITGNNMSGCHATYGSILLNAVTGSTFANNTIAASGSCPGVATYSTSVNTGNRFINNTLSTGTGTLLKLNAQSGNNTFYWNNFTSIGSPTTYVQDLNGSNKYNSSASGQNEGNIYANVMNHSIFAWGGASSTGFPALYIGTDGAGVPYNNATSGGKFSCNFAGCGDYAPLTDLNISPYPSSFSIWHPYAWTLTYYAPNSTIDINWTNSTSPLGFQINYSVYLYLMNGTLNGTIANTSENSTQFNATGFTELRYYIRIAACDLYNDICTYNNSETFGVYAPSLNAAFSPYASNDGAIVPHNYFLEFCNFTCNPSFVCNSAGANLSLIGGTPYRTLTSTDYNSSNVEFNFTNLNLSNYKRLCFIENIYGNKSASGTREVTIEGEIITGGEMLGEILILAGVALIYIAFKKEKKEGV